MVMEPMQGKLASSQFDFVYTEQFCIPGVTSVFFSSCDSVVGDSLEFSQANRGSFRVSLGKRNCSGQNAGELGLISRQGESLMDFLELRKQLGYILELRWGSPCETGVCTVKSRHLSRYEGQLSNVN